jgi:hypothetical protein
MKIVRRTDMVGIDRVLVDKLRGNAFVIAVQKLGGRLVVDDAAIKAARGMCVKGIAQGDGSWLFEVVESIRQ